MSPLTNLQKWQLYLKDIVSPESFIEMGFYYIISAALQRRVWVGSEEHPIFPNQYIVLVAKPGVGKGLVVGKVAEFLRYHKLGAAEGSLEGKAGYDKVNIANNQRIEAVDPATLYSSSGRTDKLEELPLLIPIAPDTVTFEKLLRIHASCVRKVNIKKKNIFTGQVELKTIFHRSLAFALEEISSLFHEKADQIANYFLNAWDCKDYSYETKHQGSDFISKPCLNFFGGTNPAFMQATFDDRLLNDGFASRTIFVFESSNRFFKFIFPDLTTDQYIAKMEILEHIKKLTKLYGQVTYTPDAMAYMTQYFERVQPNNRINMSMKLDGYYARVGHHAHKLAMAIHFSEHTDNMVIELNTCIKAVGLQLALEKKMHHALTMGSGNPWGQQQRKIYKFIATQKAQQVSYVKIWDEFVDELNRTQFEEVMDFLEHTGKVKRVGSGVNAVYTAIITEQVKG